MTQDGMQKNDNTKYKRLLRLILWSYIILCILIAGMNYGYASNASPQVATVINWVWLAYENWITPLFIIVGSFLTIKIIGSSKSKMRQNNLAGFIIAALTIHVIAPLLVNNYDLYFYAMPLPWSTTPLQLLDKTSSLYQSTISSWGSNAVISDLVFFTSISLLVLVGTVLFGRRLQCSTICLFNGFAAEVFDPAIPLIGKRKNLKKPTLRLMNILRWVFLAIALLFILYWVLNLLGVNVIPSINVLSKIESYKYLGAELLMMMFFWIAFVGRGYCFYCPLGTVLSLISRIVGQKIKTDNTKCVQCNKCNNTCPMSIDIKSKAVAGDDVKDLQCVGCGHCVDECPTQNLSYSTKFINKISKKAQKKYRLS